MATLATFTILVDDDAIARIDGTQVAVMDIVNLSIVLNMSPQAIQAAVPTLTLGEVHAALAYYYTHQKTLDDAMQQRQMEIERAISELKARNTLASDTNWLKQIVGQWPGDETDEQIEQALEQLS